MGTVLRHNNYAWTANKRRQNYSSEGALGVVEAEY